jgi:putative tricarboxylic transport membrane protein
MGRRAGALVVLAASVAYLVGSLAFPWGSAARPGPGFFPVAVGVFLCLVALSFVLVPGAARAAAVIEALPAGARMRVTATTLALVGFTLLMPWIGFPVVAFLFVAILLRRLGGGGWTGAVIAAVVSAGLSYYLFAVVLAVPLPRGIFID